ncbi:MAG: hypothetical protein LAT81_14420, partial [Oceanicaulis sp.]|nr:hypothetical protein [Oceanicaulis sp.]
MEIISLNKKAPDWIISTFSGQETGGAIRINDQIILLKIGDITKKDILALAGEVTFRVYRGSSVLLVNLVTKTISFDLLWSPYIAKANGETVIQVDRDEHMVFNIITIDRKNRVRAIRTSSINFETATALARGMQELLEKPVTREDVDI